MVRIVVILLVFLIAVASYAQEKTAEELVAGKAQADITYRQLMEFMGSSYIMLHEGIVRENMQMVKQGADMIINHPAPKHKPWLIMKEADQNAFKSSLLHFDKIMDSHAARAAEEAKKGNWIGAGTAASELMNACVTCHVMWKNKVK